MGIFDKAPSACLIDDLLDFNIDETEAVGGLENPKALPPTNALFSFPEGEEEEELEWILNKDVFPSVDTFVPAVDESFVDMIPVESVATGLKHESPISVLESSNSSVGSNNSNNSNAVITSCCSGQGLAPPIRRPRSRASQRRQRGGFVDIPSQQWFDLVSSIHANKTGNKSVKASGTNGITGRKCTHCGSEKTPQWRAGPNGPKTLCNACGVRFKSGRLCPEYRPANSPTFLSSVHSNSHRKIVEMRKMKQSDNKTTSWISRSPRRVSATALDTDCLLRPVEVSTSSHDNEAPPPSTSDVNLSPKEGFTFQDSYVLGKGACGATVYKAVMHSELTIAVNKLASNQLQGNSMETIFWAEIQTLEILYTRNIVNLYGFCYHQGLNLLLCDCEYMDIGSLGGLLHGMPLGFGYGVASQVPDCSRGS